MEQIKNPDSLGRLESLGISASTREANAHKGVIDTAAPFDSVKAAVNKFGGVVGWRARKAVGLEKHTDTQSEFEKVQEEIPKYKKQSEAAQIAKLQVREELESTKKLIEELKDRLEKTETEVAQAKHNSELSEIAKVKHEESIEEIKSVKEELESLRVDYQRLITEREFGITSAQEALSAARDAEKKVENLKEELRLLNDQKLALNDLKPKLESAPEFAFHIKGENDNNKNQTSISELALAKKELKEVKASIKKTNDEVNHLREAASSLKAELEQETKNIPVIKQMEDITFPPASSLEAEINKMQSKLELVLTKENEAQEKMGKLQKLIEQATQDANQAKFISSLAREELRNAKEESEQAKASARAMEAKLLAVIKEIEAAKSLKALAVAAVRAMLESEEFPMDNGVKLKLEEYYLLTKSAYSAEVSGNEEVIAAAEKIEEAKNFELMELNKLEEVEKELKERKEAAKAAEEIAEKANEVRLAAEQEFKDCTVGISHRRIASDVVVSHYGKKGETKRPTKRVSSLSCPDFDDQMMTEVKPRRKKSFFPRIVMFLARKKAQSLK